MPPRTRPPEPAICDCQKARHTHGTNKMYITHKCGCPPCKAAHREAGRAERGDANQKVDAAPARELIRGYVDAGHPVHRIEAVTGLSSRNLWDILGGHNQRTTTFTLEVLRDARTSLGQPTSMKMSAVGAARRVRALTALGWTVKAVADAGEARRLTVLAIRNGDKVRCSADNWSAIQRAYEQLWDKTPPRGTAMEKRDYTRSVRLARREGWLPPLAWDDDRIDDPAYTPNVTTLRRTRDEEAHTRLDELAHLIDGGTPIGEAVRRAGYVTERAAYEAARHAGRATLQNTLTPSRSAAA